MSLPWYLWEPQSSQQTLCSSGSLSLLPPLWRCSLSLWCQSWVVDLSVGGGHHVALVLCILISYDGFPSAAERSSCVEGLELHLPENIMINIFNAVRSMLVW